MSTARYIGRVGGLAVALGVGTAVVTGAGVAAASPDTDGTSTTTQSTPVATSAAADSDGNSAAASAANTATQEPGAGAAKRGPLAGLRKALSRLDAADEPSDTDTGSATVNRPSTSRSSKPIQAAVDSFADRVASVLDSPVLDKPILRNDDADVPAALSWLQAPRIAAARQTPIASALPRISIPDTLLTPRALFAPAPLAAVTTADAPARPAADFLSSVFGQVLNPFAGNGPEAPTDSPLSWVLAAASRRELFGAQAVNAQALTYNPDVSVFEGVITGCNITACAATPLPVSPNGNPLTYTIVSDPNHDGAVRLDAATGNFTFLPYTTVVTTGGTEDFSVLVAETTGFDAALSGIPLVGALVFQPILLELHQVPVLNTVLSPLIGQASVVPVTIDVAQLNPDDDPIAFTLFVTSFDGTQIRTNYFPAVGLKAGQQAPTILNGPGLASPGNTDPESVLLGGVIPGLKPLREAGYNMVTWDPRGEFDSGGKLELDSPFFEGRDASAIIDWVETQDTTKMDADNDPYLGMVGGSYGGGIQWATASTDHRVDAIVPAISWNSLNDALYPRDAVKTSWGLTLMLGLITTGARIDNEIYEILATGVFGFITDSQQAFLASRGPSVLVNDIDVPTLIIQGTVDTLFPLDQAFLNAQTIAANPLGVPVKMMWFCGGHGVCNITENPDQDQSIIDANIAWMDAYVKPPLNPDDPTPDGLPTFQWFDQNGDNWKTEKLPSAPGFNGTPVVTAPSDGGWVAIAPLFLGSGPLSGVPFPLNLAFGTAARQAVDVPLDAPPAETYVVGAPELTFTYSGIGTSRHVYAQIVDESTGKVVGNIVTPIPVTLDGQTHTVTAVPMESIVYTMTPNSKLKLQITGSATEFLNITAYGAVKVSDVSVSLPSATGVQPVT